MKVRNVHERRFRAGDSIGALIDTLSAEHDALWPVDAWPRMKFDRALQLGARGGHGPIRYTVEAYVPGESVRFRFTGPSGFHGWHGYEIDTAGAGAVVLRHTLEMAPTGAALLTWPMIYRPLHDALIEDSLARAQVALGYRPDVRRWSVWVRLLRTLLSRGQAHPQMTPSNGGGADT